MNLIQIALLAGYFTGIWYHSTLWNEIGTEDDRKKKSWKIAFVMMMILWPVVWVLIGPASIKRVMKTRRKKG